MDEVIFVVGPLIATVLATEADPLLVLYLGVALVAGGSVWLSTLHATVHLGAHAAARHEKVRQRVCNSFRRLPHRIGGEMGVARRGGRASVPKHLADQRQRQPRRYGP